MTDSIPFLDLSGLHAELRPDLDQAWATTVETNAFIGGPAVDRFEANFAEYCEARHAIGVANGTDALELIFAGLGLGPGDEVIVPTNTFIATVEAIVQVGAVPVMVDVDPTSALITADHVRAAITSRTAAVVPVHLYGRMVDMPAILEVAEPAGIAVIEDAAQAHGASVAGKRAGSFGVAAGFSFYPGKNLGALGDGGAVTTNDASLAERIRSMANHGRSATSKYEHDLIGRNSRLDGLQAALLDVKLGALDRWNEGRRAAARRYHELLTAPFRPIAMSDADVHHLFVIESDIERTTVGEALDAAGIGWGIHYPVPCHLQPPYKEYSSGPLPESEALAERIMSLPMFPTLDDARIERICEVLRDVGG